MTPHEAAVTRIAAEVRTFYDRGEPFRIFHGSTNCTRPPHKDRSVDISELCRVVKVDPATRVALVEPNVPMDKLVVATLAHGLIPPVVMEFPGITVGGGFSGSAGESSSFRYGYFDETVKSIEMVLANGEVVNASEKAHPDLFRGAAGALGTLGITTLLELRLIPAKKFVRVTYHLFYTVRHTIESIQQEIADPANDYVDGILFSKAYGVVIAGQLTDEIPHDIKPQTFSKAADPWFYLHVEEKTGPPVTTSTHLVDYIPLGEYLFRYDRGGFWVGAEAYKYWRCFPFNRWTRRYLDDLMHTRMLFRALHATDNSFAAVIQDLSLPYSTVEEFINYTAEELDIWPLWLCPLRERHPPTFHPFTMLPGTDGSAKPMLNVGVWGPVEENIDTFAKQNRELEHKLKELGGRKVLYSHTYYTEQEFWSLYDRNWYNKLREQYSATTLPSVYDKVKVDIDKHRSRQRSLKERVVCKWPISGFVGMYSAWMSRDYRLHKNPAWAYSDKDTPRPRRKSFNGKETAQDQM